MQHRSVFIGVPLLANVACCRQKRKNRLKLFAALRSEHRVLCRAYPPKKESSRLRIVSANREPLNLSDVCDGLPLLHFLNKGRKLFGLHGKVGHCGGSLIHGLCRNA